MTIQRRAHEGMPEYGRRHYLVLLYPDYCHAGNAVCPLIIHAFSGQGSC